MSKKAYLSGPMTGYPEYNYPAFEAAARKLRAQGWIIVSPHEIPAPSGDLPPDEMWEYYMAICLKQIKECDFIIMLEGWPESRGARKELDAALKQGCSVFFMETGTGVVVRMSTRSENVKARSGQERLAG